MSGGAGGCKGGDGKAGGDGSEGGCPGGGDEHIFGGSWQTPHVLSHRLASFISGDSHVNTPTLIISAHVETVCIESSLSKHDVSATHGLVDGGGLAKGHCTSWPSESTILQGMECGSSFFILCMYTHLSEILMYLELVGASTMVISVLESAPSEPSLSTASITLATWKACEPKSGSSLVSCSCVQRTIPGPSWTCRNVRAVPHSVT